MTVTTGDITGLILAGGKGLRMGGVDKGLQLLNNKPLVKWVSESMAPQVSHLMVSANRNEPVYQQMGYPVLRDGTGAFDGPLAGMLAGLEACTTHWLVTAPCDTPVLPLGWVQQMCQAADLRGSPMAMVRASELALAERQPQTLSTTTLRPQPVFSLIHRSLISDLQAFLKQGDRKITLWAQRHDCTMVDFLPDPNNPFAFANVNTETDLHQLALNWVR